VRGAAALAGAAAAEGGTSIAHGAAAAAVADDVDDGGPAMALQDWQNPRLAHVRVCVLGSASRGKTSFICRALHELGTMSEAAIRATPSLKVDLRPGTTTAPTAFDVTEQLPTHELLPDGSGDALRTWLIDVPGSGSRVVGGRYDADAVEAVNAEIDDVVRDTMDIAVIVLSDVTPDHDDHAWRLFERARDRIARRNADARRLAGDDWGVDDVEADDDDGDMDPEALRVRSTLSPTKRLALSRILIVMTHGDCREDDRIDRLEASWHGMTGIPKRQIVTVNCDGWDRPRPPHPPARHTDYVHERPSIDRRDAHGDALGPLRAMVREQAASVSRDRDLSEPDAPSGIKCFATGMSLVGAMPASMVVRAIKSGMNNKQGSKSLPGIVVDTAVKTTGAVLFAIPAAIRGLYLGTHYAISGHTGAVMPEVTEEEKWTYGWLKRYKYWESRYLDECRMAQRTPNRRGRRHDR